MIQISDAQKCCGCGACMQKCPKQCISMLADAEGFLYPSVDRTVCVDCGLCEKVCPMDRNETNTEETLAFAVYAKENALRGESSSGGIFTLLARKIMKREGVVFGAAFDSDFMVHHIAVESENMLQKLQGSKYLQSRIENTYQLVEMYLQAGREVLFTGTACQIAGLKHFLGRDDPLLYTVDVLCHGVPSPKLWKKYLQYQEACHGGAIQQISFREKKFGWRKFAMKLRFENQSTYCQPFQSDIYMRLFLSNICLRPSCHDCRFKSLNRPSDLTIGDSWGIEAYMPDMDDDMGTSVVLVHSKKGRELFEGCREQMVYREAETDKILPPTADSRKSVRAHPNRARFFNQLNEDRTIPELGKLLQPGLQKRVVRKCKKILKQLCCVK